MKHRHLVMMALATTALALGACAGSPSTMNATTGSAGSATAGTSGAAGATTGAAGATTGAAGATTGAAGDGTTGAAGTGTATGAAGTTAAAVDCTMDPGTTTDTISDFEDGTGSVLTSDGRNGGWYSYVDTATTCMVMPPPNGTATAGEIPGGRCQSTFAMHFSGMGCTDFGAGVGTDLAAPAATDAGATSAAKTPYDVTPYKGVSFWSRADKGASMRFKMPMTDDTKTTDGGNCVQSTTVMCSDDFGANIALTKSWVKHTVMFSTMKQEGWGKTFVWTPGHVTSLQFQVPKTAPFDLWIDDVSFVK
jgi:hypothetical protein